MMKKINRLIYTLIYLTLRLLGRIPIKQSIKLACILGNILHHIDKRHRKIALENLRHAYGSKIKDTFLKQTAEKVFRNLSRSLFEVSWLIENSKKNIGNKVHIEGVKNLIKPYSKNRGILIISGHIGAWELLPYIISQLDIILNIVYRPLDFKPLDKIVMTLRSKFGGQLISTKTALPQINMAIARGEAVGLLIDQSAEWYNGVWVDFFGHRTCTSKGIAQIALTHKIPVVPVFIFRKNSSFQVVFKKQIPLIVTGDITKDVEINTLNYTKAIETAIRKYPEQWFWVHRRWKHKAFSLWSKKISKNQNL